MGQAPRWDRTAGSSPDAEPTIIFLHVGKTAGLSMRRVLRRQFPAGRIMDLRDPGTEPVRMRREGTASRFAALPEAQRSRPRLIMGHTTYGIHEHVPRASTYITMLRRPTSLIVSLYHYVLRNERHALHDEVVRAGMSLEEFVRSGISLETDNSAVRAIAGDTTTPFGGCTPEMLETVKANVERDFSVVGLTERFDESLLLLGRTFGWRNLHYVRINVAAEGTQRAPIPPETLELIEDQNRLDAELYRWSAERLEDAIAAAPGFEEELRRFRARNRLYAPWGHLTYTFPKRLRDRVFGTPPRRWGP